MLEIFSECLHGVKTISAESESSGRRGSPGVDKSHLHHVEILLRIAYERAPVGYLNVNFRTLVQVIRIFRVAAAHHGVGNDGVDFNSGDAGTAVSHSSKHIDSAARPNDGVLSVRAQNIRQRGGGGH